MINVEIKNNKVFLNGEATIIEWTDNIKELEVFHDIQLNDEVVEMFKYVLTDCSYTPEENEAILTAISEYFKSNKLSDLEKDKIREAIQKEFDNLVIRD